MSVAAAYAGLFFSAFLSATLLPGTSEAVFTGFVLEGVGMPAGLLLAAVTGNVAGSLVNWVLGRFFESFKDRKWFPVTQERYDQAERWFARYGKWSLLFAWLPVVGDPLTIVAGALGIPLRPFLLLVTIGKLARYLFILQAALIWMG